MTKLVNVKILREFSGPHGNMRVNAIKPLPEPYAQKIVAQGLATIVEPGDYDTKVVAQTPIAPAAPARAPAPAPAVAAADPSQPGAAGGAGEPSSSPRQGRAAAKPISPGSKRGGGKRKGSKPGS